VLSVSLVIILITAGIHCLNWAVSQATNLINVNFNMAPNSQHIGIIMDGGSSGGGSGTFMGDLVSITYPPHCIGEPIWSWGY